MGCLRHGRVTVWPVDDACLRLQLHTQNNSKQWALTEQQLQVCLKYSIGRGNVTSGLHMTRWREYIYCDSNSQQVLS